MVASRFMKAVVLAVGMGMISPDLTAWAAPKPGVEDSPLNEHVLSDLAEKFRGGTLKEFEEGLADPKLRENFSVDGILLRRALLLLQSASQPDTEMKSLKELPAIDKALKDFLKQSPELKKLLEKKALTVGDMAQIEKALLVNKTYPERDKLMRELTALFDVQTEQILDPSLSAAEALKKLALRKIVSLPPEIEIGQRTPLLKEIDTKLRALLKEADPDSTRNPTLKDLGRALASGKLKLSPEELTDLNGTLSPIQVQENGGFGTNEVLRQLYRTFASKLPPEEKRGLSSVEDFFGSFAKLPNDRPAIPLLNGSTVPLQRLSPFTPRLGGGGGGLVSAAPTDRLPSVPFDQMEERLGSRPLSPEETQCLTRSGLKNYELQLNFASKPGSTSFCSSAPVAPDPEQAKATPKRSTEPGTEGQCEADFFTAKHCVEPGDLQSLAINGVNEPISHAAILVANTAPSVSGGDDVAILRVVMSCAAAATLTYQKLANSNQARQALGNGAGVMIARNREINVEPGGPNFVFGRGYEPNANAGEFSGFSLTNQNGGKKVKRGDSGGPQVACVETSEGLQPRIIGATSTILVTDRAASGSNLGRAASLGSLDWAIGAQLDKSSPGINQLVDRGFIPRPQKNGADRAVHPTTL